MGVAQSQLTSPCLTAKFGSFLDHAETGEKGQNVLSYFIQHPISLIFAIHVSFIKPLPMMWILLTKPMQKSVTTVCLHCSFARLKNKHLYGRMSQTGPKKCFIPQNCEKYTNFD